jgi:hypothetical protein
MEWSITVWRVNELLINEMPGYDDNTMLPDNTAVKDQSLTEVKAINVLTS